MLLKTDCLSLFTSFPFSWDLKAECYGATDGVCTQINSEMTVSGTKTLKMYSVFCTVHFASANNGENRILNAARLEKGWRAAVLPQREGGKGG